MYTNTNGRSAVVGDTLSYVVITYNRVQHVMRCLDELARQALPFHELIVVDNGSTDGTAEAVKAAFPQARVHELPDNLGVGGARDVGIRSATGDICILIDDDARFASREAAMETVNIFRAHPDVAVIAYCIRNSQSGDLELRAIPKRDKRPDRLQDGICAYFTGAGFAIRRDVYDEVGPFWQRLFYIGEELDLSYRIISSGYSIRFVRGIEVLHDATPQARPSGQYVYFNTRNRPWIALRHLPWRHVVATTCIWWAAMAAVSLRIRNPMPFLRGVRDSLAALPDVLRTRDPLRPEVVTRIRRLSGRVWY